MFSKFCLQIKKVYGKEAFLFGDLLEDIKHVCEENGTEESIITNIRTLKMKIKDTFTEEISFYPNGKHLTVHSSDINLVNIL